MKGFVKAQHAVYLQVVKHRIPKFINSNFCHITSNINR
jgi:hypothetical protein